MPNEVRERVTALIAEVGRVERESETVFLELGRLFTRLSAEMERGARAGDGSLGALSSLGGSGGEPWRENRAFIEEASSFFDSLRARDSAFLERIQDGISRLGDLEEIISRVRADSEEMEIISLNAMTVALKSGSEGKAFSVITDELKRLSGRTIFLAGGVTATGRSLLEYFGKLRGALAELDGFQRDFFDTIDRTLGEGFAEIGRELSGAKAFFSALLGEARGVREPVRRVMGGIQLQDIVRQSLQHVGISLEEARAASSFEDESDSAFVAAVAELSRSLVEDVISKLESSERGFSEDMSTVSSIVGESERKRLDFLGSSAANAIDADQGSFQARTERYLSLKRAVVALASKLSDQVAALEASFKGLAAIQSRFQNIVVASRIEVAKTKALAVVAGTVGGMIALTGRIEVDVDEAMGTTRDFTYLARQSISGYSADGGGEGERVASTLAKVEADLGRLSGLKESLRRAIGDFSLYTEDFIRLIARAGEELASLRRLAEDLRSVGGSLDSLKNSLPERLGEGSEGADSERLRQMVERFTIFTHKKAAGAIGSFAVEEGSEAGEILIF
jgi:hypothetical protein